jgi:hypothetical protein
VLHESVDGYLYELSPLLVDSMPRKPNQLVDQLHLKYFVRLRNAHLYRPILIFQMPILFDYPFFHHLISCYNAEM